MLCAQVNSNGVLSFRNTRFNDYLPRPFPFESPPLIAPFWDDFNPRRGGMIYYRQINDTDQLQHFYYNYSLLLKDGETEKDDFYPTHLFIATWYQVPPYISFGIQEVYSNIGCVFYISNTNPSAIR